MFLVFGITMGMTMTACGDDDDDSKGGGKEDIEHTTEKKIVNAKVDIAEDPSYIPSESDVVKVWTGEYKGWDNVQQKNTTIRRKLTLLPNGTYTNIIAGKLIESGKEQFFKFESEGGTYTYEKSTRTIYYTCEYDSVLNYKDQTYTKYNKKHYYNKEQANYTEVAKFSEMQQGKRVWITKDMYLQSLTAEVLDLVFSMSEYAGENKTDQNK